MSTFSKLRVGKKRHLAGSAKLILTVDTTALGVVGNLPPGAIVLSARANVALPAVTVGTETLTCTLADTEYLSSLPVAQDSPEVEVTTAATGLMFIEYVLDDALSGVND